MIGLIARADSRGLGIQLKSFHDQMCPARTMVVDCPSAKPLPIRRDWYPDATWIKGLPTAQDFRTWLDGLDVVYTAETGYGPYLWTEAKRAGVKTVLHANYEFLNRQDQPTLWAAPSMWHFDDLPEPKVFLPVPIDTQRFRPQSHGDVATRFVHVIGRPAAHDRNGTGDVIAALRHVRSAITVTLRCQEPGYAENLLTGARIPPNVTVAVESGDLADNADLYRGQDVLILPRRFGGLCLPAQEAIGSGLPVVMTDISPNNMWLPGEWLVPASKQGSFMAKQRIDIYRTDPRVLAAKIDQIATDVGFCLKARQKACELREQYSWETLRPEYERVLSNA